MSESEHQRNSIGIVGPCSAGKSTLIDNLRRHGYPVRHIAQEHSYVPDMWKRLVNPIVLIYLDVSYNVSMQRRALNMNSTEFDEQRNRLENAIQNANLYLHTDLMTIQEVTDSVILFLKDAGIPLQS